MNKVYILYARGGYYDEAYNDVVRIFATKESAESYKNEFLPLAESEGYNDLEELYIQEWDVH